MPTQTYQTEIGLSADDFLSEMQAVVTSLGGQVIATQEVIKTAEKFNRVGEITSVTLKAQIDPIRTLTAEYYKLSKAQIEAGKKPEIIGPLGEQLRLRRTKIDQKTPAIQDVVGPPKELFNVASGISAAEKARALFPAPTNATLAQLAKYENSISKIQSLVQSGKISGGRADEITKAFQSGGLNKLTLSGDEQKLVGILGQINTGFKSLKETAESFGLTMKNVWRIGEALVFKEALSLVLGQLQQGVQSAIDFQIKISEIRTLSQENQSAFNAWSVSIAKVSDELGIPQIEVAKAAYEGLSAQVVKGREETIAFTKAAGDLARVGVSSIGESGKTLASVFNAYGISANRAEEISAKLFKAVDLGNFTVAELGNHMGRVTGAAAAMGVQLDELLGALTTLSRTTNPADSITQLTNVILKLQKPGKDMQQFIKQTLGFDSGQAAINALGLVGVLKEIEKATRGDAAALALFGQELRAIRGITGLTQGGKGGEFARDVAAIRDESLAGFREAKDIRGESAGDKITKELNKVANFFTNEFGQSILNAIVPLTETMGGLAGETGLFTKETVGLFKVIKTGVEVVTSIVKVYGTYLVVSRLGSVSSNIFATSLARLATTAAVASPAMAKLTGETKKAEEQLTRSQKAANAFSAATKAISLIATFTVLAHEIREYAKEMDDANKKSEEFENILARIEAARKGKTPGNKNILAENFQANMVKESANFATMVDNLNKPLMLSLAESSKAAHEHLRKVKEEGAEAALQLQVAFKGTTDAIGKTIRDYTESISKSNRMIEDSKKNILSVKETVQSLIHDLKMDFASDEQKFSLRVSEIQRLESERNRLGQSDNPEDLAKAQQLGMEALRQRKDLAKAAGDAQIKAEENRRTAMGRGAGSRFPDNSPITPDLAQHFREIENAGEALIDINRRLAQTAKENIPLQEKNIEVEKERERLLVKRIADLTKISVLDDEGKVKKEFLTPTGKFDENKFTVEFTKQLDLVKSGLSDTEKKLIGINQLRQFELALIKEGRAAAEADALVEKQRTIQLRATELKDKFEQASKQRIEASKNVETASKEFAATGDLAKLFVTNIKKDSSWRTIGDGPERKSLIGKGVDESLGLGKLILFGIEESLNAVLPGRDIPHTELDAFAKKQETLLNQINDETKKFNEAAAKLSERDASGQITATEADVDAAKGARAKLNMSIDLLINRLRADDSFTAEQRAMFAGTGKAGASIKEMREQSDKAFNVVLDAIQKNQQAIGTQQSLRKELVEIFGAAPVAIVEMKIKTANQLDILIQNTAQLPGFSDIILNAVTAMRQQPPTNAPANIPEPNWLQRNFPNSTGGGFHSGGMIHGPLGRDNLLIRAEAGEFVMSQANTKKWLPQLIAMNSGRNPKIPGHYHEGGLVQTNVGDVNVTITGPVSPEKNVRQIGNALRRSIRRGNLDLTSKR